MKTILLSAILFMCFGFSNSLEEDRTLGKLPKFFKKNYSIIEKDSNVYVKNTYISNIEYLEYIESIKNKSYKDQLPNSTPNQKDYFRHPDHRNEAVVNITREQALSYCKWLQETLSSRYDDFEFNVSLPTAKEAKKIALVNHPANLFLMLNEDTIAGLNGEIKPYMGYQSNLTFVPIVRVSKK